MDDQRAVPHDVADADDQHHGGNHYDFAAGSTSLHAGTTVANGTSGDGSGFRNSHAGRLLHARRSRRPDHCRSANDLFNPAMRGNTL